MSRTQTATLDLSFSALVFLLYFLGSFFFNLPLPVLFALLHMAISERDTVPARSSPAHRGLSPETDVGTGHIFRCVFPSIMRLDYVVLSHFRGNIHSPGRYINPQI